MTIPYIKKGDNPAAEYYNKIADNINFSKEDYHFDQDVNFRGENLFTAKLGYFYTNYSGSGDGSGFGLADTSGLNNGAWAWNRVILNHIYHLILDGKTIQMNLVM
jgi:hypothetical protein